MIVETMNIDLEILGAVIGAVLAGLWPALQANRRAGRVEKQIQPNGDGNEQTLRQILLELLRAHNHLTQRFDDHLDEEHAIFADLRAEISDAKAARTVTD